MIGLRIFTSCLGRKIGLTRGKIIFFIRLVNQIVCAYLTRTRSYFFIHPFLFGEVFLLYNTVSKHARTL